MAGKGFFESDGCRTARICTHSGETKPVSDVMDLCANDKNLYCDKTVNRCVCKENTTPAAYIKNLITECQELPSTDKCCKAPFVRSRSGKCYYVSSSPLTRRQAERTCKSMNAKLADIDKIEDFIKDLKRLKVGRKYIIRAEKYWVGGLKSIDTDAKRFTSNERKRRLAFARRCGGSIIPKRYSSLAKFFGDKFDDDDGGRKSKQWEICFSFKSSERFSPVKLEKRKSRLDYICEQTPETRGLGGYKWKPWVKSKGKKGHQSFKVKTLFIKQRANLCSCPTKVQCRFFKSKKPIRVGKKRVNGVYFSKPLALDGIDTRLACRKRGRRKCPSFECRLFCPSRGDTCADNNDCSEDEECVVGSSGGHSCVENPDTDPGDSTPPGPLDVCMDYFFYDKGNSGEIKFRGPECNFHGDVHARYFDTCFENVAQGKNPNSKHNRLHYQGFCRHTAVKCNKGPVCKGDKKWAVNVELWDRNKRKSSVSWLKSVHFRGCGTKIDLLQGKDYPVVMVNNEKKCLSRFKSKCVKCKKYGKYIGCTTDFGLFFSFDGISKASIKIDNKYKGLTKGLCGTYSGRIDDEYKLRNGKWPRGKTLREKMFKIGREWLLDTSNTNSKKCEPKESEKECTRAEEKMAKSMKYCGIIQSHFHLEAEFEECVDDYCSTKDDATTCDNIRNAYETYIAKNPTKPINWRKKVAAICPKENCPANMEYVDYDCERRQCSDLYEEHSDDTCSEKAEGCTCKQDYYFDGSKCVSADDCGCTTDNGDYIPVNETLIKNCNDKYTCTIDPETQDRTVVYEDLKLCKPEECEDNTCSNCECGRVKMGNKCVNDNSCPLGFTYLGMKCYKFISSNKTWEEAMKTCAGLADGTVLLRIDEIVDFINFRSMVELVRKNNLELSDATFSMWTAGCDERAAGSSKTFNPKTSIPNSISPWTLGSTASDNPNNDTCNVQVAEYPDTIYFRTDDPRDKKFAMCVNDPQRRCPVKCSVGLSVVPTENGAELTTQQIAEYKNIRPDLGHRFCKDIKEIKCINADGEETKEGITCNVKEGFRCNGDEDCKSYKVKVCCIESENNCELFPNVCLDPQKECRPHYFSHSCNCKPGTVLNAAKTACVQIRSCDLKNDDRDFAPFATSTTSEISTCSFTFLDTFPCNDDSFLNIRISVVRLINEPKFVVQIEQDTLQITRSGFEFNGTPVTSVPADKPFYIDADRRLFATKDNSISCIFNDGGLKGCKAAPFYQNCQGMCAYDGSSPLGPFLQSISTDPSKSCDPADPCGGSVNSTCYNLTDALDCIIKSNQGTMISDTLEEYAKVCTAACIADRLCQLSENITYIFSTTPGINYCNSSSSDRENFISNIHNILGCPVSLDEICWADDNQVRGNRSDLVRCDTTQISDGPVGAGCVCDMGYAFEIDKCIRANECGCVLAESSVPPEFEYVIPANTTYIKHLESVNLDDSCDKKLKCDMPNTLVVEDGSCPTNSECINDTCQCIDGFRANGKQQCSEVIELDEKVCWDEFSEFSGYRQQCECKTGYGAICGECVDINECDDPTICGDNGNCTNGPGNYSCSCLDGFENENGTCVGAPPQNSTLDGAMGSCEAGPVEEVVSFNFTFNGKVCTAENVIKYTCKSLYCVSSWPVATDANLCCESISSHTDRDEISGRCTDGSVGTTMIPLPRECHCVTSVDDD